MLKNTNHEYKKPGRARTIAATSLKEYDWSTESRVSYAGEFEVQSSHNNTQISKIVTTDLHLQNLLQQKIPLDISINEFKYPAAILPTLAMLIAIFKALFSTYIAPSVLFESTATAVVLYIHSTYQFKLWKKSRKYRTSRESVIDQIVDSLKARHE